MRQLLRAKRVVAMGKGDELLLLVCELRIVYLLTLSLTTRDPLAFECTLITNEGQDVVSKKRIVSLLDGTGHDVDRIESLHSDPHVKGS